MRIGSVSGIAGRGDSSIICPVPDAETLPWIKYTFAHFQVPRPHCSLPN